MRKLDEIPKNNPFRVPEGYFDDLTGRIMSSTRDIVPAEEKKGIVRRLRPYLAAAASVAAIAVLAFGAFYLSSGKKEIDSNGLTFTETEMNIINEIDLLTLEEKAAGSLFLSGDLIPEVNSSEIIDYLITENIDINDIYENL